VAERGFGYSNMIMRKKNRRFFSPILKSLCQWRILSDVWSVTSLNRINNIKEEGNMFKIFALATFALAAVGFPWHRIICALMEAGVPLGVPPFHP